MKKSLILFNLITSIIFAQPGQSSIPNAISFQGLLTHTDGSIYEDGEYSLTFRLFINLNDGTEQNIWEETHASSVSNGVFAVILGSIENLPGNIPSEAMLETQVGEEILSPRQSFTSVPFAFRSFRSQNSMHAIHADTAMVSMTGPMADTVQYAHESHHSVIADTANYVDLSNQSSLTGVAMIHSTLDDAPNTYATIGNLEFRYNSTEQNGYIEVRTLSSYEHMQVYCTKKTSSWSPGGSGTIENYHNDSSYNNSTWNPLITLWEDDGWNGRVTLSTYKAFEGTMFTMGSGGAPPEPKSYRFFANIDGYNNVFIRVEYAE